MICEWLSLWSLVPLIICPLYVRFWKPCLNDSWSVSLAKWRNCYIYTYIVKYIKVHILLLFIYSYLTSQSNLIHVLYMLPYPIGVGLFFLRKLCFNRYHFNIKSKKQCNDISRWRYFRSIVYDFYWRTKLDIYLINKWNPLQNVIHMCKTYRLKYIVPK